NYTSITLINSANLQYYEFVEINETSSFKATSSSGPSAINVIVSPFVIARLINPIILLALILFPSFSRNKSAANRFASWTNCAAGRACRPDSNKTSTDFSTTLITLSPYYNEKHLQISNKKYR